MDWQLNYYPESSSSGKTFDDWVEELSSKLRGKLYFLEIGAMDGVNHDPLYEHIVKNSGWIGILVEPVPDMFHKLKKNYRARKNLKFENSAITEKNGYAQISRIPLEKVNNETPYWADGISTLKPDSHIISQNPELNKHIVKEKIATITFQKLAEKYSIKNIDLLQIDTEGYDKQIFDQIWQAGFRPSLIKLEINYMPYKDIKDLRWLLENSGYNCFYQGDDLIAVNL